MSTARSLQGRPEGKTTATVSRSPGATPCVTWRKALSIYIPWGERLGSPALGPATGPPEAEHHERPQEKVGQPQGRRPDAVCLHGAASRPVLPPAPAPAFAVVNRYRT